MSGKPKVRIAKKMNVNESCRNFIILPLFFADIGDVLLSETRHFFDELTLFTNRKRIDSLSFIVYRRIDHLRFADMNSFLTQKLAVFCKAR